MTVNLGQQWSKSLRHLVELAIGEAQQSPVSIKHGAVLFSSMNCVHQVDHNDMGSRVCGYDVPSLHAEAKCLRSLYCRSSYYSPLCRWEKGNYD